MNAVARLHLARRLHPPGARRMRRDELGDLAADDQPHGRRPGGRRPAPQGAGGERLTRAAHARSRRCGRCWRTSWTASPAADPETMRTGAAADRAAGPAGRDQLLDLSRLDNGAVPLDAKRVRGVAVPVGGAEGRRAWAWRAPGHRLGLRQPRPHGRPSAPGRVAAGADRATRTRERLHQVVANLIDNAVKHSPPQRPGDGAGAARRGCPAVLELEVLDEGPGIPRGGAAPGLRALQPRRRRPARPGQRRRYGAGAGDRPLGGGSARRPDRGGRIRRGAAGSTSPFRAVLCAKLT